MSYTIRHSTKRGGSGMFYVETNKDAERELLKFYKQRLVARVEKDNIVIGEVVKHDVAIFDNPRMRWTWYIDTSA